MYIPYLHDVYVIHMCVHKKLPKLLYNYFSILSARCKWRLSRCLEPRTGRCGEATVVSVVSIEEGDVKRCFFGMFPPSG